MKSILDNSFRYTPSFETDLAKKFENIRKALRKLEKAPVSGSANDISKTPPLIIGKRVMSDK